MPIGVKGRSCFRGASPLGPRHCKDLGAEQRYRPITELFLHPNDSQASGTVCQVDYARAYGRLIMQRISTALWASPPALRSEIFRKAFLGQDQRILLLTPLRFGITGARAYHRPRTGRIRGEKIVERRVQSTSATATPQPSAEDQPKRSRTARFLTTTALCLILFTAGFTMSVTPAAETINGYVNPPTDEETLHLYTPPSPTAEEINDHILNHPLAVKLRSEHGMVESRPHMRIPPAMRPHNLTGGTLAGEGKLTVPPLNFNEKGVELPSMVQLMYFGPALCGHPGIVHGGFLATMLDEGLARACFDALPNKVGVTASLKIDYRVPCPAGNYVVLKAYTTKVEGRKAWCKGWIELLGDDGEEGVKLVEAEALFIEPKGAKNMAKNIVASN